MQIKSKLLLFTLLASSGVALAGASGVWPLWQLTHAAPHAFPSPEALQKVLKTATQATCLATALTALFGFVASRSITRRLSRLRNESDAVATGQAESVRVIGTEDVDQVAATMNELSARVRTLDARQVREEELVAAKRYADNVINSMFDVLIVADPELRIETVNKAACELLEYTELELVGRPIESLLKEEPTFLGPSIRELLRSNQMRDFEATYRTRSGRLISVLLSASTMRDNAGRPLAIITVGKDITARKQIERELLDAKATAEAASRAKSAFVANMSHEIRTPMTAILGYADLLTHPSQNEADKHRCIATIRRNGEHLLSIINDILDVSKIEAGKMTVEQINCSPCQLIADVSALMKVRAVDKGLSFDVRYIGSIPQTIQTDPTRLRQILMNLIGNAIKFTSRGNVKLLVSLADPTTAPAPRLRFDVIDTGVGLTTDQQGALFKPFAQADSSTTRKFGGTGLGLTISKRLARLLGGDLVCNSEPGAGSTFSLTVQTGSLANVPILDKPQLLTEAVETPTPSAETARFAGRILLAEDGQDNRVLITYYLKQVGLEVIEVENGVLARDKAMEALRRGNPFDLVLMDMQMPELDGYGATAELRKAGYRGPIVALTAHALGGDREKCLEAGCDDFAVKPIDHDAFIIMLKKFLSPASAVAPPAPSAPENRASSNATLARLLSKPGTARLVEQFVMGLPQRLSAIEAALSAGELVRLGTLAHQLKGAAGGYGFTAIGESAARLESAVARGEGNASLSQLVSHLQALCESVRDKAA